MADRCTLVCSPHTSIGVNQCVVGLLAQAMLLRCGHELCSVCVRSVTHRVFGAATAGRAAFADAPRGSIGGGARRQTLNTTTIAPVPPNKRARLGPQTCVKCPFCRAVHPAADVQPVASSASESAKAPLPVTIRRACATRLYVPLTFFCFL